MKILISNDDGVYAQGLKILYQELKKIGQTWVVAPLEEKSTTGHSLTIHKPLRVHKIENGFFGVNGSPADSVYIGIREVIKSMPDLVVSGINRGANLGQDVYYSGTVSAARACILGLPSLAVSLDINFKKVIKNDQSLNFVSAAKAVSQIIKSIDLKLLPKHTLLNINVPNLPSKKIKGLLPTRLGFRFYSGTVLKRVDHRGKPYYWIGGQYKGFKNTVGTDCQAVSQGYIAITPVQLDATNKNYLDFLKKNIII